MKKIPFPGWRARLAIEASLVTISATIMIQHDAPTWALALLVFTATRASWVNVAASLGYMQQTLRRGQRASDQELEEPARSLTDREADEVASRIHDLGITTSDEVADAAAQKRARHGVGRWGREQRP